MDQVIYLYYYERYGGMVNRVKIERQTDHFYFANNIKIPKKRMVSGSGWQSIRYHLETSELLEKYKNSQRRVKINKLITTIEKLVANNGLSIDSMDKILNLDIPELK